MDQTGRVRRLQSGGDLACVLDDFLDAQLARLHESSQVTAVDVLHDNDEVTILGLGHILDLNDVRAMREPHDAAGLIHKLEAKFRVGGKLLMQPLDDVSGAQDSMIRQINRAKSAAAELTLDRVVALDDRAFGPDLARTEQLVGRIPFD